MCLLLCTLLAASGAFALADEAAGDENVWKIVDVVTDGHGTVTSGAETVALGQSFTVTVIPEDGYRVDVLYVDGVGGVEGGSRRLWPEDIGSDPGVYTFIVPEGLLPARCIIYATFAPICLTLDYNCGELDTQQITQAARVALPSAQRSGYALMGWSDTADGGVRYRPGDVVEPTADCTLYAVWAKQSRGIVSGSAVDVNYGDLFTSVTVDMGNRGRSIITAYGGNFICGSYTIPYTLQLPGEREGHNTVSAQHLAAEELEIYVLIEQSAWDAAPDGTYTAQLLFLSLDREDEIGSEPPCAVVDMTVTVDRGSNIPGVAGGGSAPAPEKIIWGKDQKDRLSRGETAAPAPADTARFEDVGAEDSFAPAVEWAVKNSVTNGTDGSHFSPGAPATRAQTLAFIWRAAGCPEPETDECPFTDVPRDGWAYKAVLWAYEKGIAAGMDAETFAPDAPVTRAQAAAFIYRYVQLLGGGFTGAWMFMPDYSDAAEIPEYAFEAACWMKVRQADGGPYSGVFGPRETYTRAQVLTLLYVLAAEYVGS